MEPRIRLLIAGSRTITDLGDIHTMITGIVNYTLGVTNPTVLEIISGHADGVDKLGEEWARWFGVPEDQIHTFEPNWKPNGVFDKGAGFKRNQTLVDECTHAIIFWDPNSETHGSLDTLEKLTKYNRNKKNKIKKPFWVFTIPKPTEEQIELEL